MKPLPKIDLHIHSKFSDGEAEVAQVAKIAKVKRLAFVGLADHYSSSSVGFKGRMGRSRLKEYLREAEVYNLLKGVEVDIGDGGELSLDASDRKFFNYVAAGVHELEGVDFWEGDFPIPHPEGFVEEVRVAILKAMESKLVDVVAHPTWLPPSLRGESSLLITEEWMDSIVKAASSLNVAIEVNGMWQVPDERMVAKCLKDGVKIATGSDAHRVKDVGDLKYPLTLLSKLGAKPSDLFLPEGLDEML